MNTRHPKILGLSASLRNARYGAGSELLVDDLERLATREELFEYLKEQAQIRLEDFVSAGRDQSLPFDRIYRNLQERRADQGLSNSEVVLAAGLWGARQVGCDIEHIGLSRHFPANQQRGAHLGELKSKLMDADAILLSTPVYFGDRSSVAHDFIEMIRTDSELRTALENKVYAGISVGAKRNGGQETALIYQLLDLTGIGMLGVGNDSDTTSQYGGTAHAGDVGTVGEDEYGLNTSIGVGKRIGHVSNILKNSTKGTLTGALRVQVWLVQDSNELALREVKLLTDRLNAMTQPRVEVTLLDLTRSEVHRCLACDICPTDVDKDEVYRCIVQKNTDALLQNHSSFLEPDAIIIAAASPVDRSELVSTYQRFMERTRYLRRGDYVLSDVVIAPLVFEELGSKENLHIRMLTSMLRHHTVMTHPIISYVQDGEVLNRQAVEKDLQSFVSRAAQVSQGRCVTQRQGMTETRYTPIGYVLSTIKDRESETLRRREIAVAARTERKGKDAGSRLKESKIPVPALKLDTESAN